MKYLALIASLLLVLCSPSSAQFNGCQAGFCAGKVSSVAPAYTGPGDVAGYSGAYAYWGLRAYNAAYATANGHICDLVDQSGANSITINALANGNIDLASINAWVTAHSVTTIRVNKLYDQSGHTRDLTPLPTQWPALILSGVGLSAPSMAFDGGVTNSPSLISSSNAAAQAQPFTISTVTRFNTFATNGGVFGDGGFGIQLFNSAAATIALAAGGTTRTSTGVTDGQFGSIQVVYNGASSSVNAANAGTNPSGTPTTIATPGANGIGTTANKLVVGALTDGSGVILVGNIFEVLIVSGAVSSGNQASQVANQRAYGGF